MAVIAMNENDNYRQEEVERRLGWLENHYQIWNEEFGQVKVDMAQVKNDVYWIKKFLWIIITSSVGTLIATLIGLLIKSIK